MADASDANRMARLWGGVAGVYDTAFPFFTVLGSRLVEVLDPQPGERVLDVATGRGACLFPAVDRVSATGLVVGIDLSWEMITETAAEVAARDLGATALMVADAQRLPVASGQLDVVMCSQAVGQLPDVPATVAELRRVLRDGGRIGIQRDTGTDERWGFIPESYTAVVGPPPPPKPPINVPTLLEEAGFVDVERREDSVEFLLPDKQTWWDWVQTTGGGLRTIAPLTAQLKAAYRDAVFERMEALRTPAGFPIAFTVECVVARR